MLFWRDNKKELLAAFLLAIALTTIFVFGLVILSRDWVAAFICNNFFRFIWEPLQFPIWIPRSVHLIPETNRISNPLELFRHLRIFVPVFLISWLLLLWLPMDFIKRRFSSSHWFIKYVPSLFFVVFVITASLPSLMVATMDDLSKEHLYVEKCIGSESRPIMTVNRSDGYDCLIGFISRRHSMLMGGSNVDYNLSRNLIENKKIDLVGEWVDYCLSLPNKLVNQEALRDRAMVSDLSYDQLCLHLLPRSISDIDKLLPYVDNFTERFPEWKTIKTTGARNFESDPSFQNDAREYICEKAYGHGALRGENEKAFSNCMNPYPVTAGAEL